MANNLVLMEISAMPMRMKRVCLTQEVVRILRNTKKEMPKDLKDKFISEFALRMKDSGYSHKFRKEVIECGVKSYEKQVERERKGECPLHRPKGYNSEERQKKKNLKRTSWYKSKGFDTVLFCPPTTEGKLAKELRDIVDETSKKMQLKVKVVERAGVSVKNLLPGLQEEDQCNNSRSECFIHRNGGKGNCRQEGVVYQSQCMICETKGPSSIPTDGGNRNKIEKKPGVKSIYVGETSRSGFQRGRQHMEAVQEPTKHRNNAFAKHMLEYHHGKKNVVFKTSIVGQFKRPMERQICEGVNIYRVKTECDVLMNSKMDHFQPAVARVRISNQLP